MEIILGIQIKVNDVIAKGCHVGFASGSAAGVRWPHICRKESEDVVEGNLIVTHLIQALSLSDSGKILMTPSMRSNLMTLRIHTLDKCRPSQTGIVNHALCIVISGNEKRCFGVVRSKEIQ